jgi:hypothetical protein
LGFYLLYRRLFWFHSNTLTFLDEFKISVQVEVNLMSNELFVELNDEQQEIVAGGAASLDSASITVFDAQTVLGGTASMSGPGGSVTASQGAAQDITTFGVSLLSINAG